MRRSFLPVVLCSVIFWIGCNESPTQSNEPPKEEITAENVLGTWYMNFSDQASGVSMILYLENGQDSARVGILNGTEQVELICFSYEVSNGQYSFVTPPADTASMNAIQIMMAEEMEAMLYTDKVYVQSGKLVFDEGTEKYSFSSTIPAYTGGVLSGTVECSGKDFGQGAVFVVAVDPSTEKASGMFLDSPGAFTISGLSSGNYYLMAVYISKKYAANWQSMDVTDFPYTLRTSSISVESGAETSGIAVTIDLTDGLTKCRVLAWFSIW